MKTEGCSKIVNVELKESLFKTMFLLEKKGIQATLKGLYNGNLIMMTTTPIKRVNENV